jgi:hypothetical protein
MRIYLVIVFVTSPLFSLFLSRTQILLLFLFYLMQQFNFLILSFLPSSHNDLDAFLFFDHWQCNYRKKRPKKEHEKNDRKLKIPSDIYCHYCCHALPFSFEGMWKLNFPIVKVLSYDKNTHATHFGASYKEKRKISASTRVYFPFFFDFSDLCRCVPNIRFFFCSSEGS